MLRTLVTVSIILSTLSQQLPLQTHLLVDGVPVAQPFNKLDFYWYRSVNVNTPTNFTAIVIGGISPYTYGWDFGDSQTATVTSSSTLHTYTQPGNYSVTLTVTDSASNSQSISKNAAANYWPATWAGWTIHWNITSNDGVDLWNITWHGRLVIRDARMAGILVRYKDNYCLFYDEFTPRYTDTVIFEYSPAGSPDPWVQIRSTSVNRYFSLVGGYWYQQVWRFYASGRWDAEVRPENGGGCTADHYYEPHFRFDLALGNSLNQVMSQYTAAQNWRNLVWEGNYTDNTFRDSYRNGTQWRIGGNGSYYYLVPLINPTNKDFPIIPSRIYLVRDKANEIETTPNILDDIEDPGVWINTGELAFNNHIAFWFLGSAWVHAPLPYVDGAQANLITVSFFPSGL